MTWVAPVSADRQCGRVRRTAGRGSRRPLGAPARLLFGELAAAGGGDGVEARLPVLLGGAPAAADPARLLHTVQRRIQRSLFDAQAIGGSALDVLGDRVPVERAAHIERAQHEEI